MSNELYKPTLPVEPGWYRCERVESDDVDCCLLTHWGLWSVPGCGNPLKPEDMSEKYLFGPRVEMPVAEPVEVFAVFDTDDNLLRLTKSEEYARDRMAIYSRTHGHTVLKKCVLLVKEIVQ